jgi:protein SCO1/2
MLTDTSGKSVPFGSTTSGHPTFLYFGYTSCPDVCPTTMADIRNAISTLPVAQQRAVDVVFVSTDVANDTASIIRQWLTNFSRDNAAHFIGLRGNRRGVDTAQVQARVTPAEDDGHTHSAQVLLFGANDYAPVEFLQSNTEAAEMTHDLKVIVDADSQTASH